MLRNINYYYMCTWSIGHQALDPEGNLVYNTES